MTSADVTRAEAAGRIALAKAARAAGRVQEALAHQTAATDLLKGIATDAAYAHALRHVIELLVLAGRATEATPLVAEMLALYRADHAAAPLDMANAVRCAAIHAHEVGDDARSIQLWREGRERYVALAAVFRHLTGRDENPGVVEADRWLATWGNGAASPRLPSA